MTYKSQLITASILCLLAVALGAFGAHGLKEVLNHNGYMDTFKTGIQYHIFHSIGIFIVGILNQMNLLKRSTPIFILFLTGIILFSGSLYLLAILKLTFLGIITPFGGVAFILGWSILAFDIWKVKKV